MLAPRRIAWLLACCSLALGAGASVALAQGGGSGGIQNIPDTSTRPAQPAQSAVPGVVDLRPKFRAGQSSRYVYEQTAKNKARGPDPSDDTLNTDSELSQRIALVMRTTRADAEGSTVELVYESVRVTYKAGDDEATFDSSKPQKAPAPASAPPTNTPSSPSPAAKPGKPTPTKPATPAAPAKQTPGTPAKQPTPEPAPADPLAALDLDAMLETMLRPMVGSKVTVELDRNGAITKVSGGQAPGGMLPSTGGLPGLGGAGFMPDPKQVADWLVSGAAGSNGTVRVGQTWTNSDALGSTPVGPMRMHTTHTLRSALNGVAQVAFVGNVEGGGTDAGMPMGVQITNAAYAGTYQWDTRAGSLSTMHADMRVEMLGGPNLLNLKLNSETQVRVSRVEQSGLPRRD